MHKRKNEFRIEKDSLGSVNVPLEKLWGAQTQRSLENFQIGPQASMPLEIIYALAIIKKCAAQANCKLGVLSLEKCNWIELVCDEIVSGKHDSEFPLVIWQTGSGTQTNMNVNEVISNRIQQLTSLKLEDENKLVHPNDDVNKSQSSNDTFPTAMHMALYKVLKENTLPSLSKTHQALLEKEREFEKIIKIGRTHFMDATPLTLGQEFSAYRSQIGHGILTLENNMEALRELALGGTAVGTGLNTPKGFDILVAQKIAEQTGFPFVSATNKFAALSSHDSLVEISGTLKRIAVSLMKIGNDLRFMASGPRSGIGELLIPDNEPGSSIMPGKVNPTQIEALTMVCAQIIGSDTTVTLAGSSGHFELNVFKPVIISNLLQSAHLLADVLNSFVDKCLIGIQANEKIIKQHLNNSLMLVTALNAKIGYKKAAEIAQYAHKHNLTLKDASLRLGYLTTKEFDAWVDPKKMI